MQENSGYPPRNRAFETFQTFTTGCYVAGQTVSSGWATAGSYDTTFNGGAADAFVAKVSATGMSLLYMTYLGGSGDDGSVSVGVDSAGNAYVSGRTDSAGWATTGSYDTTYNGGVDAFVAKVNPAGTGLLYMTYLGGSADEGGSCIAVDSTGNVYVTGRTGSSGWATAGSYDTTYNVGDGFVAKLSSSGTNLLYMTYLGSGRSVAVDSAGNAYVTGYTTLSGWATGGSFDPTYNGGGDAFVAKLNATGASLLYMSYLGGSGDEQGYGIAVDSAGNTYVTGYTFSSGWATAGSYDTIHDGSLDAFVVKLIVNTAPTDIALSTNSIVENQASGATIGAFSSTDPDDASNTFAYTLVSGTGSTDNASFTIDESGNLKSAATFDFETKSSYAIRVRTTDQGGLTFEKQFTITVTGVNDNTPVITSNGGGASASISVAENTTAVTTVTATDADLPSDALTYSVSGGADAAKFSINSSSGVMTFSIAPNFEVPTDVGADNIYNVTVQASDGTNTDTQAIAVTVTAVNDNSPVITTNSGGTTASISIAENTTAVTTVTATDADLPSDALTYSVSGGADAARFSISSSSGVLTFTSAPNFEAPTDLGGNNIYDLIVQVSDGTNTDTQAIAVTVTAVNDNNPVSD